MYAIESESVIEIAKAVARQNGFEDRVVFIHDLSFRTTLPESIDVIVTETMGNFGVDEGLLGSVIDARERFLKPNGKIIPRSLNLLMAPVELPGFYAHMVDFWVSNCHGVDFSPVRRLTANNFHPIKLHEEAFLSQPSTLVHLNLLQSKQSDLSIEHSFYVSRRGKLHGMVGWFTAELCEGMSVANAPVEPCSVSNGQNIVQRHS